MNSCLVSIKIQIIKICKFIIHKNQSSFDNLLETKFNTETASRWIGQIMIYKDKRFSLKKLSWEWIIILRDRSVAINKRTAIFIISHLRSMLSIIRLGRCQVNFSSRMRECLLKWVISLSNFLQITAISSSQTSK